MIVCLCPSPAVDLTYRVASLAPGATHRVTGVVRRPGGKAVNVARILHARGERVRLLVELGGATGAQVHADLEAFGLDVDVVRSDEPTRHTVTVVDDAGAATVLAEPAVAGAWSQLCARLRESLVSASVVVVSGSLPEGAPADAFADVVRAAHEAGRPVVVDTSGRALAEVAAAVPTVMKPNVDELRALTGIADPLAAATAVAHDSGTCVVASLGPDGVLAVNRDDALRVRPGATLHGNPTGAGDALVAGIAGGLARGQDLRDFLPDAVALSAAAVLQPDAGYVDDADVQHARAAVVVTDETLGGRL